MRIKSWQWALLGFIFYYVYLIFFKEGDEIRCQAIPCHDEFAGIDFVIDIFYALFLASMVIFLTFEEGISKKKIGFWWIILTFIPLCLFGGIFYIYVFSLPIFIFISWICVYLLQRWGRSVGAFGSMAVGIFTIIYISTSDIGNHIMQSDFLTRIKALSLLLGSVFYLSAGISFFLSDKMAQQSDATPK